MQAIDLQSVPSDSACAAVARSSDGVTPEFLIADDAPSCVIAALWRRRHACLSQPQRLPDHLLSYCAAGGGDCVMEVDGERRRVHHSAGTVTFVPAGHAVKWYMDAPRDIVHVHLYLPPQLLGDAFRGLPRHGETEAAPELIGVADPWIGHYVKLLLSEVESCARSGTLGDSCFLRETGPMVMRHLTGSSGALRLRRRSRVSPLRPALLSRIEQFVGDNLAADIPLEALAGLVSMSVDHFVRAFDQAMGMTPHHYLVERRLERACTLLHDSGLAIADVAQACGFSSPAHFSAMFHRRRGLSPSRYRQL